MINILWGMIPDLIEDNDVDDKDEVEGKTECNKEEVEKEKAEETTNNQCLVSILNLVVDHTMMALSPLEPDEFRWKLWKHLNLGNP